MDRYKLSCIAFVAALFSPLTFSASESNSSSDDFSATNIDDSLVEQRVNKEERVEDNPFVITPHKANYLLPFTYNSNPNTEPFEEALGDDYDDLDKAEAKFQISFKLPLAEHILGQGQLFFAYTNQSWWQVYNRDNSAPFRETVHEPEFFLMFPNDWQIAGMKNSLIGFGLNHQSNGQSGDLSRSWNRVMGNMVFERGPLVFNLQAWWRIPEEEKSSEDDATGDDNPDINKYMGNFELTGLYGVGEHRFTMMVRNNLREENKGALQVTWSYPIYRNIRLYTQYFNGYGESLVDYNSHTQRFGVGIALNDLL